MNVFKHKLVIHEIKKFLVEYKNLFQNLNLFKWSARNVLDYKSNFFLVVTVLRKVYFSSNKKIQLLYTCFSTSGIK